MVVQMAQWAGAGVPLHVNELPLRAEYVAKLDATTGALEWDFVSIEQQKLVRRLRGHAVVIRLLDPRRGRRQDRIVQLIGGNVRVELPKVVVVDFVEGAVVQDICLVIRNEFGYQTAPDRPAEQDIAVSIQPEDVPRPQSVRGQTPQLGITIAKTAKIARQRYILARKRGSNSRVKVILEPDQSVPVHDLRRRDLD